MVFSYFQLEASASDAEMTYVRTLLTPGLQACAGLVVAPGERWPASSLSLL